MKNKRGFTLVELLAIIVILAVIMVIAVPKILDVVNGSKDSAWKNNVSAIKKSIVKNNRIMDPETGSYNYSVKNLCRDTTLLSKIAKIEDTNVACADDVFVLTGTGKFEGKRATIVCKDGKCEMTINEDGELVLPPGLYDDDNNLLFSWSDLVNIYGLDINFDSNGQKGIYVLVDFEYGDSYELIGHDVEEENVNKWHYYDPETETYTCVDIDSIESNQPAVVFAKHPELSTGTRLYMPDSVTSIGKNAFYGCRNLKTISLPSSLKNIDSSAFGWCTSLEKLVIPGTVEHFGYGITEHCASLQTLKIMDGVTEIGDSSFEYSEALANLILPNTLVSIGNYAFSCADLRNVTIPYGVKSIGEYAFGWNHNLSSVTIPETVERIGNQAFVGSPINDVVFKDPANWCDADDDCIPEESLSNSSTAAKYLSGQEGSYYGDWFHLTSEEVYGIKNGRPLKNLILENNRKNNSIFTNPTLNDFSEKSKSHWEFNGNSYVLRMSYERMVDNTGLYSMDVTNGFGGANGTTYYFRGNPSENYVKFANMIWRIVRINEDGTVRIALDNTVYPYQKFNSNATNVEGAYYSNSTLKAKVDAWYDTNIGSDENYSSKIATGNYFCEAAKVRPAKSNYVLGNANMAVYSEYIPNLNCNTDGNGKGLINDKVGLLTYDEAVLAGLYYYTGVDDVSHSTQDHYVNRYCYLTKGKNYSEWLMSPIGAKSEWRIIYYGGIDYYTVGSNGDSPCWRPVVNLKADVLVTGKGWSSSPYVVK